MSSSKKILVTGAAGFIGSHLIDALLEKKFRIRCLVRRTDDLSFLPREKVEVVFGDITKKEQLKGIMKGVDIVYHLAAKTDFEGKWRDYYLTNVIGTKNILNLAIQNKIKKFIFFSTIRVVGLRDSLKPVKEIAKYDPINFYDKSKVLAEKLVLEAFNKNSLPVIIIRPTSVYGPRDKGTYYSFFKTIAKGQFFLIGKGDNLVSFVFVKNVIEAAVLAIKSKESSAVFFINDDRPYSMKELSSTIAQNFNKKIPNFYLPKILGYFFATMTSLLPFKLPLTKERVRNLTINYVFDISRAKKELGYEPKFNLKDGVKQTVNWYKKNGWI